MPSVLPSGQTLLGCLCGLLWFLAATLATADHASCELTPDPIPPGTHLAHEPAQRAIILWNGREELLLLSTDLAYYATGTITEGIPLPAEPTAQVRSLSLFSRWAGLLLPKGMSSDWLPTAPRATVVAPLTIGRSDDPRLGPSLLRCDALLGDYRARGYPWLVLDKIGVHDYVQSYDPIEYRFKASQVFYPLAISTLDQGITQVDLFIVTWDALSYMAPLDYPISTLGSFTLTYSELAAGFPDWARFMSSGGPILTGRSSIMVQHLRIRGDIRNMAHDFLAH